MLCLVNSKETVLKFDSNIYPFDDRKNSEIWSFQSDRVLRDKKYLFLTTTETKTVHFLLKTMRSHHQR